MDMPERPQWHVAARNESKVTDVRKLVDHDGSKTGCASRDQMLFIYIYVTFTIPIHHDLLFPCICAVAKWGNHKRKYILFITDLPYLGILWCAMETTGNTMGCYIWCCSPRHHKV